MTVQQTMPANIPNAAMHPLLQNIVPVSQVGTFQVTHFLGRTDVISLFFRGFMVAVSPTPIFRVFVRKLPSANLLLFLVIKAKNKNAVTILLTFRGLNNEKRKELLTWGTNI